MTSRWATLRRLTWSQRAVLVEASLQLPVTILALRVRGLTALGPGAFPTRSGTRVSGGPAPAYSRTSEPRAAAIAAMVEMAIRHGVMRASCLQRSVTLWRVLRRHGIESEVRIGVRRAPGEAAPSFHAWVELDGVVLNERPWVTETFVTFDRDTNNVAGPANFDAGHQP